MIFESFKRTAIHNIRISSVQKNTEGIIEGLVIPRELMKLADILPFEQIVVTNNKGGNWDNRHAVLYLSS
jgi:aspartate 1-decarboxylase